MEDCSTPMDFSTPLDFATPDEPNPPFETTTELADTFPPQLQPLTFTSIASSIISTPGIRSEATTGYYNTANIRIIQESFTLGFRAQRFTDMINRVGQEVEWWRAVPHVETQVPVGQNVYQDPDGYSLRNPNVNPAEELLFERAGQFLQLKGYLGPTGETTIFQAGITEVVTDTFRIQSPDFSVTYQMGIDYTLNSECGQVTILEGSAIPFNTLVKASYLISEPCIDPYTRSARPECPIDNGDGYVYSNGAGIMDRDGKTMLFGFHSDLDNARDESSISFSRSSGGTSFFPIVPPVIPSVSGFESQPVTLTPPPNGPGMAEVNNNLPRFSYYDRPERAMLMLENQESNLMIDSSFEVDPLGNSLSLWNASVLTATTDNTFFIHGNQAALLNNTANSMQAGLLTQTHTLVPGTYLFYAHVRFSPDYKIGMFYPIYNQQTSFTAGNFPISIYASSVLSAPPLRTTVVRLGGMDYDWVRIQAKICVPPGGNAVLNIGFMVQPNMQVWVDAVQLQTASTYPTSYIPTTYNALMRNPDVLGPVNFLGNLTPFQGGISFRIRPNWDYRDLEPGDRRWLFKWGDDPQRIWLYYQNNTLVLSIGALDEAGNPKTVDVTMPWCPLYEKVYKISALWDNTQGNYLAIDNQWIENILTPVAWNPSDYSAVFYIGSDENNNNFDGWLCDFVGWGLLINPQEAMAIYYQDDQMTFNTDTRIKVIVQVPSFKTEWSKAGFFQEGDVEIVYPANLRITADNIGSLEENNLSQHTLARHKIRILGKDFRALSQPEWMLVENETVAKRLHLRLIQTSSENTL